MLQFGGAVAAFSRQPKGTLRRFELSARKAVCASYWSLALLVACLYATHIAMDRCESLMAQSQAASPPAQHGRSRKLAAHAAAACKAAPATASSDVDEDVTQDAQAYRDVLAVGMHRDYSLLGET